MAELLLIFRTNEQFCPFQHRLHHYRPGIRDLHHPVKFQCQVLLTFNIQHHSADIRFMHRTDNLSHYGESTSAGEGYDLFPYYPKQIRLPTGYLPHGAMPVHNEARYIRLPESNQ